MADEKDLVSLPENHIDAPLATQADFSPYSRDSFGEFLATEDCVALSEGGETPSPAGDSFDDFLAGSDGDAGEAVAANPENKPVTFLKSVVGVGQKGDRVPGGEEFR